MFILERFRIEGARNVLSAAIVGGSLLATVYACWSQEVTFEANGTALIDCICTASAYNCNMAQTLERHEYTISIFTKPDKPVNLTQTFPPCCEVSMSEIGKKYSGSVAKKCPGESMCK